MPRTSLRRQLSPVTDDSKATKRRKLSDRHADSLPASATVSEAIGESDVVAGIAYTSTATDTPAATPVVVKKRGRPSKADMAARAQARAADVADGSSPNVSRRHSARFWPEIVATAPQTEEPIASPLAGRHRTLRARDASGSHEKSTSSATSIKANDVSESTPSKSKGVPLKPGPGRQRKISVKGGQASTPDAPLPIKKRGRPPKKASTVAEPAMEQFPSGNRPLSGVKRFKLKVNHQLADPLITHPFHVPLTPKYASLEDFLASFIALDEDVTPEAAHQKRAAFLALRQQVDRARAQGLLEAKAKAKAKPPPLKAIEPVVSQSHQDILSSQACYFSKLMHEERRRNLSNARKIAGMIQQHFKRISGADERLEKDLLRLQRGLAKKTASEVRRKWRLAEKEVQRRQLVKEQEEQRALGKEHLNQILDHSTSLLGARRKLTDVDNDDSSEAISDDEDHYLSVEQLRDKYAHIPDVEPNIASDFSATASDEGESSAASIQSDQDQEDAFDENSEPMDSELDESEDAAVDGPGLSILYPELSKSVNAASLSHASQSDEVDVSDYSPMDSELESGSNAAEESDGPGLSSLYPELHKIDRASSSMDAAEVDSISQTVPRPATRQSNGGLLELPSDQEMDDQDNDSPMDSEMDDADTGTEVSEASSGPGLAYLYSMPNVKLAESAQLPDKAHHTASPALVQDVSDVQAKPSQVANDKLDIKTPVPFLLRGTLREYQHIGLDWMAGLFQNGTNGILADEMGLGKTIQTISLLTWLACEREVWGPHLIIVPTSVMLNWEREFKKFAPGLKVLTYYGNPKERKEKRRGWSKPDSFHVVITSYQLVISDQATFRRRRWEYMILDEAHNIKNFKSQRWQTLLNFNTAHRLLLTGTPLQNNLNELWSLLYFLMPQGLTEDASFAKLSEFQEWFGRPVDKLIEDGIGDGMNEEARNTVAKLHRILRPYILRRLKADVEKQMPGKFEHVIECRLSKRQRFLYDDFMSRAKTRETLASGNFLSIINCFMQLRKVCNHPDLFESRPIVTSFAMYRSAAATFETKALLVQKRLLQEEASATVDLNFLNLRFGALESRPKIEQLEVQRLAEPITVPDFGEVVKDDHTSVAGKQAYLAYCDQIASRNCRQYQQRVNRFRTQRVPVYGTEFLRACRAPQKHKGLPGYDRAYWHTTSHASVLMPSYERAVAGCETLLRKFGCITPKALVLELPSKMLPLTPVQQYQVRHTIPDAAHFSRTCTSIAFPDKRLLQFDCGKLQRLDTLLRDLIPQGHRVLIFTQMTRMLDILEQFLNIHGHRYFRLDGATKIEQRQQLTERFNNDPRIPVFILSTRSGGLGINLTGANVVIFFDSDWNPCMDRQCQDRAHRIGQTRDVHIYRFVSQHTIEQNIMRKANQKRMLDNVVIGQGDFTTDFFNKVDWRDMLGEEMGESLPMSAEMDVSGGNLEATLAMVEDEDDAAAARVAEREMDLDAVEFSETRPKQLAPNIEIVEAEEAGQEEPGSVDDYMIGFLLREAGRLDLLEIA